MAEQYTNRTNRALSFARIQLKQLEQVQSAGGWSQDLEVAAFEAGICFHLAVALHAYRREIAERYSLPTESIDSLADLIAVQQTQGQSTSEATEFEVLAETPSSWLNQLERRYAQCWGGTSGKRSEAESLSEISLVQIEPGRSAALDLPLSTLYSELFALVSRQRAAMQEW